MTRNFKKSLNAGFTELRKRGYFAKQKWACCQSCGIYELPDDVTDYVFYHMQDAEYLAKEDAVFLNWGGNGHEIADVFRSNGLVVDWDGLDGRRICVKALA